MSWGNLTFVKTTDIFVGCKLVSLNLSCFKLQVHLSGIRRTFIAATHRRFWTNLGLGLSEAFSRIRQQINGRQNSI